MRLRKLRGLPYKVGRYGLDNVSEVVGGCDEQGALFGIGRADFVDPRQDERACVFLYVSDCYEVSECVYDQDQNGREGTYTNSGEPVQDKGTVDAGLVQVPLEEDDAKDDLRRQPYCSSCVTAALHSLVHIARTQKDWVRTNATALTYIDTDLFPRSTPSEIQAVARPATTWMAVCGSGTCSSV